MGIEEKKKQGKKPTHLVREFRVYAMRTLGDLKLAIGGRENPGNFWDWETKGLSLRAIACCFVSVSQAQFPPQRKKKLFLRREKEQGRKQWSSKTSGTQVPYL